jgi:hypothetical protein
VYKQQNAKKEKVLKADAVKSLVDRQRKQLPRIGTRKIYYLIKDAGARAKVWQR